MYVFIHKTSTLCNIRNFRLLLQIISHISRRSSDKDSFVYMSYCRTVGPEKIPVPSDFYIILTKCGVTDSMGRCTKHDIMATILPHKEVIPNCRVRLYVHKNIKIY